LPTPTTHSSRPRQGHASACSPVGGLDQETVAHEVTAEDIKNRLAEETEAAIAAGVVGVPTVPAPGQGFWADDHVEAAAAAMREDTL
jgi:2-hydroxychromene-2-carboxylate isomerase